MEARQQVNVDRMIQHILIPYNFEKQPDRPQAGLQHLLIILHSGQTLQNKPMINPTTNN